VAWLLAAFAATTALWKDRETPGEVAIAPHEWPETTRLARVAGRPVAVLFVHPLCPCTPASIEELRQVAEQMRGKLDVHVVFALPDGTDASWRTGPNWQAAAAIPGAQLRADEGAEETRRFRARTSGLVALYDAQARLVFNGGITGARGCVGDNGGRQRMIEQLLDPGAPAATWPVFGCALDAAAEAGSGR
jgi:hypothetical protein